MLRWRYLKTAFSWWFGLIWAGVGSVFAIIALALLIASYRFESHGVTVAAAIVERGHSSSSNNGSHYWLKYVYHDAAGVEHISSADVSWTYWRNFNDGDSVPIQYLADHPSINRLADEQAGSQWVLRLAFGAFGLGFGGIGWFLVIRAFIRSGQRARLMHLGVGALGNVTGIEVHANVRINGRNPLYLTYQFTDAGGAARTGRSPDLPLRLQDHWNVGDPIFVAQDPIDPGKFEVDLFDVRAEDFAMLQRSAGR